MICMGRVVNAVRRELRGLAERDMLVKGSVEESVAVSLAVSLDDEGLPLRDRVAAARQLAETMAVVRQRVPVERAEDRLDQLAARRAARRAS